MTVVRLLTFQIKSDGSAILAFHYCAVCALIQVGFERLWSPRQSNTARRFERRPQISLRLDSDFRHSYHAAKVFCFVLLCSCVQSWLQKVPNLSMGGRRPDHCVVLVCFHISDIRVLANSEGLAPNCVRPLR